MIKKFNKYLLENHPLVWNTRLVWMLGILTVMHLSFFTIGYFSYFSPVDLHSSNLFDSYLDSGFVWIGILLSILIFILWMNQYFKQNAFKSHYPKSNFSIYKEFLIIFLISILTITQYLSYTTGLQTHVAGLKTTEELEREIDLTNRAAAFTLQQPYYRNDGNSTYEHQNRCIDVPIFDSLVLRDEVLKRYVENMIAGGHWQNVKLEDYKNYSDSLQSPLYSYREYLSVLSGQFPERETFKDSMTYNTNEVYEATYATDATTVNTEKSYPPGAKYNYSQQVPLSSNLNSIYNYCGFAVIPLDTKIKRDFYAKENYKLLNGNQKSKIQSIMKDYLKLADEYKVGYRFKDKNWIDYVYNPPYYFTDHELTSVSRYSEINQETYKKDYIAQTDMENALGTIKKAKSGVFESYTYLIFLYIGLWIALLIFTFRTSTMRTWVISIVGSMVIFFIYFCIYFVLGMMIFDLNETSASILFLVFMMVFFLLALGGIFTGKRKLVSGINLNWSIWSFPAFLPLCVTLYSKYLDWKYPYNYQKPYIKHPNQQWIDRNWENIFYVNIILVLIFILILIPIIKKWKAMPEE